jgi:hypothetical protein
MEKTSVKRALWWGGGVIFGAVLAVGGGTLYAQVTTTVISACVNSNSGRLSITESGQCGNGETLLSWNATGPAGAPGADGEQGEQGEPGISGLEQVVAFDGGGDDRKEAYAACPPGKMVIGGGANIVLVQGNDTDPVPITIKTSLPFPLGRTVDPTPGYMARAYELDPFYDGDWTLVSVALCAYVAP